MNGFVTSKTQVFENIEEPLGQSKGVEDLNDDENIGHRAHSRMS